MIGSNDGNSIDAGETVQVQYSASGSFAPGNFTVLQTIGSNSGTASLVRDRAL